MNNSGSSAQTSIALGDLRIVDTGPRAFPPESVVFGATPQMLMIQKQIEGIKNTDFPVLIEGENGTGKEIVAYLIHVRSRTSHGPFVKLNCSSMPASFIESELFGYEGTTFTEANGRTPAYVQLAKGGTLLLDEIGDLDRTVQGKLLHLFQEAEFCPTDNQVEHPTGVRVICSTNRKLQPQIDSGAFRQDLYYRIDVVNLQLLPLRERTADIPQLVTYFLEVYNQRFDREAPRPSARVMQALQRYHWPGNIRQLENVIKRYVMLGSEDVIELEVLLNCRAELPIFPSIVLDGPISLTTVTRKVVREMEKNIITSVLQANHWNGRRAARALNIGYRTLLRKLRKAQVTPPARFFGSDE